MHNISKTLILLLAVTIGSISTDAYGINPKYRQLALLDMTARNGEGSQSNIYSAEFIAKTAGIPYIITTVVDTAVKYAMVFSSSSFKGSSGFTSGEKSALVSYVNSGGVLVVPHVSDSFFNSLFGISGSSYGYSHYSIRWNALSGDSSLRWIDDPRERTIRLGDSIIYPGSVIGSRAYTLSTATPLATYGDGTVAVIKNTYGSGHAYALGVSLMDMILRCQINHDFEAQRNFSNHFEPSSDVFMLFIKGLYAQYIPYATWKHSAPLDSKYVLMFTHDVDCRPAMDTMHYFADYEQQNNIIGTYFVTTHYIHDDLDNDYYTSHIPEIAYVASLGHVIGSHSVGHFPDFDNPVNIPEGLPGNTQATYSPHYSVYNSATTDATVFGEMEVSKGVLQTDIGVNVKSWRSGYLCYPADQAHVLDSTGYMNSSTNSANVVLSNFPFFCHQGLSFTQPVLPVFEIPNTIDVDGYNLDSLSSTNYISKANTWLTVVQKVADNYAPVVFLIHPTELYKLDLEDYLIQNLPAGASIMNLESFASYWHSRDTLIFSTERLNDSVLQVTVPDSLFSLSDQLSLVINNGQSLSNIIVRNQSGSPVGFHQSNWENNDLIIYFYPTIVGVNQSAAAKNSSYVKNYPNPFIGSTNFEFFLDKDAQVTIQVFDHTGREIKSVVSEHYKAGLHLVTFNADNYGAGIYFYTMTTPEGRYSGKMMLME
ncbi:MAG: T9SS type A sorting domain-containing protein [Bacteroidota bacterium]